MPQPVPPRISRCISLVAIILRLHGYRVIEDKFIPEHNIVAMDAETLLSYDIRTNKTTKLHKDQFIKLALNSGHMSLAEKIAGQKFIIVP